jgi:c-di-GMP-binding flagellar brake protein YcgR
MFVADAEKTMTAQEAVVSWACHRAKQSLDHAAIPAILAPSPVRVPGLVFTF